MTLVTLLIGALQLQLHIPEATSLKAKRFVKKYMNQVLNQVMNFVRDEKRLDVLDSKLDSV